jgi:hypothetical protein
MCYNKDISIYTYILGLVSSYLLLINDKKNLKILGCFFMIVIQMQLVEYFLWINNTCNTKNIELSEIGALVNYFQPIVLYGAIIYYNKNIKNKNKNIITTIIFIYIISFFIYSLNIFNIGCTVVTPISSPYLEWSWLYTINDYLLYPMFPISLIILIYFGLDIPYNLYLTLIGILSFMISFIIYNKQRAFGTIWCWFVAFIPSCILLYDRYIY